MTLTKVFRIHSFVYLFLLFIELKKTLNSPLISPLSVAGTASFSPLYSGVAGQVINYLQAKVLKCIMFFVYF